MLEQYLPIIDLIQSGGFIGLLILLAFPKTRKWLGFNGNGSQAQIDELKEHARVANEEMALIRSDISDIKGDLEFIKGKLSK